MHHIFLEMNHGSLLIFWPRLSIKNYPRNINTAQQIQIKASIIIIFHFVSSQFWFYDDDNNNAVVAINNKIKKQREKWKPKNQHSSYSFCNNDNDIKGRSEQTAIIIISTKSTQKILRFSLLLRNLWLRSHSIHNVIHCFFMNLKQYRMKKRSFLCFTSFSPFAFFPPKFPRKLKGCAIAPILLHFENVSKSLKDLKFFSRGSLQTTQMLKFSINNRNGSENTAADGAFYTQAKKPPFSQPSFLYIEMCMLNEFERKNKSEKEAGKNNGSRTTTTSAGGGGKSRLKPFKVGLVVAKKFYVT